MTRGGRWISSQCDYFLGLRTDRRKFRGVHLRTPFHHNSDHRAIITGIRVGDATKMKAYRRRMARFPVKLPFGPQTELCSKFEELQLDVVVPPPRTQPQNSWILAPTWALIDKGPHCDNKGGYCSRRPVSLGGKSKQGCRATGGSMPRMPRRILRCTWRAGRQRKRRDV